MLTGGELYPGLTAMQVILQVSQHSARPDVPEGRPPALVALMQRCWAQDPAQRPQAAEVVEDVRGQLMALRPAAQSAPGGGGGAGAGGGAPPRPPPPPRGGGQEA